MNDLVEFGVGSALKERVKLSGGRGTLMSDLR
jgi:hypothetical protein